MKVYKAQGFTLIELLIVIALIAVLAGAVIIALNPAHQFALARDSERWSHVSSLAGTITQRTAENKGLWACTGSVPVTPTVMKSGSGGYDICSCLVPNNVNTLPIDPSGGTAHWTSCSDYDTGYTIVAATSSRVTIAAPSAEAAGAGGISVTQ